MGLVRWRFARRVPRSLLIVGKKLLGLWFGGRRQIRPHREARSGTRWRGHCQTVVRSGDRARRLLLRMRPPRYLPSVDPQRRAPGAGPLAHDLRTARKPRARKQTVRLHPLRVCRPPRRGLHTAAGWIAGPLRDAARFSVPSPYTFHGRSTHTASNEEHHNQNPGVGGPPSNPKGPKAHESEQPLGETGSDLHSSSDRPPFTLAQMGIRSGLSPRPRSRSV
jgi:hypothetical protein